MRTFFLRTTRLGFDWWQEADGALAWALWGDPAVTALLDARGALSPEQVAERLAAEIRTAREHGVQYWPVFRLSDGDLVGCCGLRPNRAEAGMLELGVHIRSHYWRQGYAAEAAAAVIARAPGFGARALFAGHNPANAASHRLIRRLGFRYTHDERYAPTGLMHPSYRLDLA